MKKTMKKISYFFLFVSVFVFSSVMTYSAEAKSALASSTDFDTLLGSGSGGSTASSFDGGAFKTAFKPMIDFMLNFRTVIIIVFAVVATVLFFAGVFKFLGNPDLSQIIPYIVGFAFIIIIAFAFYKFVDKTAGTEIPVELLKSNVGIVTTE